MSKLVHVDTQDRESWSSSTCDFHMNYNVVNHLKEVKSVSLEKMIIPNTFYTVNAQNKNLELKLNGVAKTYTLTEGYYSSITQLKAELDSKLTVDAMTSSYDAVATKFTLDHATSTIQITADNQLLGFRAMDAVGTNSQLAQSLPDMRGQSALYVHCDFVNNHFIDSSRLIKSDVLAVVNVGNINFGETIYYESRSSILEIDLRGRDISSFRIYLTDSQGNILNNNNMDWTATLLVR